MPHLILNPQFVPDFFPNNDLVSLYSLTLRLDTDVKKQRHFGVLGHQLLGDLISLFFREQLCEMKRSALLPSPILRPAIKNMGRRRIDDPPRNVWPTDDVFQAIPHLYLWERVRLFSFVSCCCKSAHVLFISHHISLASSILQPL
jgi:hypothetical protein